MTKKKKLIVISAGTLMILIIAGMSIRSFLKNGKLTNDTNVYVSSAAEISETNQMGMFNRFSGVVEPQKTMSVEKSTDKTVKEILVHVGDNVKVGTPLFTYDTDEIAMNLSQAEIDLESIDNTINSLNNQIAVLEKEKAAVPSDEKLNYTTQIQEAQNELSRAEYNKKSKAIEIEQIKKSLDHTTITSEIEGVIKSINASGETDPMSGEENAFITIMATGNYRIKGKINETNATYLSESAPVIIRSRTDLSQTWTGVITTIDFENPNQNNNNYYSDAGNGEQSTSYPFYVDLDSSEQLFLGQHVYIEPDFGQNVPKEGLWLMESYLMFEGDSIFVWKMNAQNKLEKAAVETGEYNPNTREYQILAGIEKTDYIAWPENELKEGMSCIITGHMEVAE